MASFLKSIFSIKKEAKHICFNILGIKLRITYKKDLKQIKKFFKHNIEDRTILLIEPNNCHYETLLGYYNYLKKLNFNVEIITRGFTENLTKRCVEKVELWECNCKTFDYIFENYDFSKYYCLIFNSQRVYWKNNNTKNDGTGIEECYAKIPKGQKENIYVQHHLDFYNENPKIKQIVLANPQKIVELDSQIVNPHFFGKVNITQKNKKIIKFITVGELNPVRRNSNLLIESVDELHKKGIFNFQIIVIGKGSIKNMPSHLRKYFKILGRVDFPTMFNAMEEADYFLPLLDPESELHQRYMKYGTSGSFQLIYGFLKPCIIHKTFADIYGFSELDSIVYCDNSELSKSMLDAIECSQKKYREKQDNLKLLVKMISENSLKNLDQMLGKQENIKNNKQNQYNIVSLGNDCLVRRYLTRAGIKPSKKQGEISLPFDLAFTPTKSLIRILQNDFQDYFDDLIFSNVNNIWINKKYNILYNHDKDCSFNDKGKLIERFQRRIKNFKCLVSTNPSFCFFICKSSNSLASIYKLYKLIKQKRKNLPFKLIILNLSNKNFNICFKNLSIYFLKHPFKNENSWWENIESKQSVELQKNIKKIIEKEISKKFRLVNYIGEDLNTEHGEY